MKRIKVIVLTLALGLAGAVYAANSYAQSAHQEQAESCCTGQSGCCTDGSCCSKHKQ